MKRIAWLAGGAVALVTALHLTLNFEWAAFLNRLLPEEKQELNVAFIPVT
jgi:hypothetical protein